MIWVDKLSARTWSILVIAILAFAISGCEGDTGPQGPQGEQGAQGEQGDQGEQGEGTDAVEQALNAANVESCNVCHEGNGAYHQAAYDEAFTSDFELTIDAVTSVGVAAPFTITIDFSVNYLAAPFIADPTNADEWVDGMFFARSQWDATAEMFQLVGAPFSEFAGITGPITSNGGGSYTLTASVDYDINSWDSGAIVGKLSDNEITDTWPDSPTSHFHVYDDLTLDAFEVGVGSLTADYTSLANVEGCEACHGAPYRKHANVQAQVAGAPDFTYCKNCHYDDRTGGHFEWQLEVDDPLAWANDPDSGDATKYAYTADVMNVTHMSHAMHFPYPQSMSNCVTCHDGNLTAILDDSYFAPETCKSCHAVEGVDAWPPGEITGDAGIYYNPKRAPALDYLTTEAGVDSFHDFPNMTTCTQCHGTGGVPGFSDLHTGYDKTVYDATGTTYTALAGVAIDDITISGNLITVDFSSLDDTVNPTLAISFYGWDSKHHIVPAHERDGNSTDCPHSSRPGCNIEWSPTSGRPFFTEDPASIPGDWRVTFDMTGFQPYKTDTLPNLIANGEVTMAEITILPRLTVDGVAVNVDAVSTAFELGTSVIDDNYFAGTDATVDIAKCDGCHENTGVLIHAGRGRYGDSMQACKVCHNPTFDGSHLEMQSRSIDSYVHALHAFQPLDEDDVYNDGNVVDVARNTAHKTHTFPNFTSLSCEGCHNPGTYEVPNQALSMPGVQSPSWTLDDPSARQIGTVPDAVQGAASRACGSCHRAELIKVDAAGDLAAFDAHTAAFGTFVENSPKDADEDGLDEEPVLFGVIDKIMGLFQ
ncbi:MAG: hypothetical protein GWP62_11550 [Gammaproteobacteria bacterium]|nr:hypothetical protein [Gammaproteobacteria bacterium]